MFSALIGSHVETLAKAQQVTTTEFTKESEYNIWGKLSHIIAELVVSDTNAVAGDTLVVLLETISPSGNAYPVLIFTTVLGNAATPHAEVLNASQSPSGSWFDRMRIRATPAGGSADFTFTVYIRGS